MATSPHTTDAVIACPAASSAAALRLVFDSLPDNIREQHIQSILRQSPDGQIDGLLAFRPNGTIDAALFVEPQAGRVASFWGPSAVSGVATEHGDVIRLLIDAGRRWAHQQNIELAQTLVSDQFNSLADIYSSAGFSIRSELDYLVSHSHDIARANDNNRLQLDPYAASGRDALAAIITETYHETRDCPGLNGLRAIGDVVDGYADAGDSGDEHWFLVRCDEQTVGVLLLAEHAAQNQAELVYMGVVPSARGRGFGLHLTRLAQQKTRQMGLARLILAVDANNQVAIDVYRRAGFISWDRRSALLCPLKRD